MGAWFSAATPQAVDRPRILADFAMFQKVHPENPGLL